jgi:uncharacterized protein (DUF1786 family)
LRFQVVSVFQEHGRHNGFENRKVNFRFSKILRVLTAAGRGDCGLSGLVE